MIRMLASDDVPRVAELLARALHDDPAYTAILPGSGARRHAALTRLFRGNLRLHLPHACTRVLTSEGGPVLGTLTLRPPGGVPAPLLAMLRHGLVPFALAQGVAGVKRLVHVKERYDALEAELARGQRYFHLHMMAVSPDEQGRGHGSELLGEVLASAVDEPAPTLPVLLTTHRAENVTFYRRAGFDVVDERELVLFGARFRVWGMRRAPFGEQVGRALA